MIEEATAAESKPRRERGSGSIYRPKYRDRKTGELRECRTFWIQYYRNGRAVRENTRSDKITVAKELLKRRQGELAAGQWVEPKAEKVRVEELIEALVRDYDINERKALYSIKKKWEKHLKPFFGAMRAVEVTTDALDRYVETRRQAGAENATINRELAMLRRAFSLAYRSTPRKVHTIPNFDRLRESDPRSGFVDEAQYSKLCQNCPALWLRAMLAVAYAFGFRKGELLGMRVRQVDLFSRTIRLEPGTTKNRQGRSAKMTEEVFRLLVACVSGKDDPDAFVFTRGDGEPVREMRDAWAKLVAAAELPGLLFHDLRRSAVRNMIRRGIPEVVAMKISGHKTRSVFDRYNIVSEADITEAAERIERGSDFARSLSKGGEGLPIPAHSSISAGRAITNKPQAISSNGGVYEN
jgi:integrase